MPIDDPPFGLAPDQMLIIDFRDIYKKADVGWRIGERRTKIVLVPDALRPMLGIKPKS
jgi:hypothetical protein